MIIILFVLLLCCLALMGGVVKFIFSRAMIYTLAVLLVGFLVLGVLK